MEKLNSGRITAWKGPSQRPILWVVGLGVLSLAMLASSFLPNLSDYAFSSLLISLMGLSASILGLYAWVAASWVRRSVARERLEGSAVWPIRALTASKRYVRGLLEVREDGLEVRLKHGTASMGWDDLTVIETTKPGAIRGGRLIIEGTKFGHAELELLEANAVTDASEEGLRELVSLVKSLSSGTESGGT